MNQRRKKVYSDWNLDERKQINKTNKTLHKKTTVKQRQKKEENIN
jgi:hypothetical protein